MQTLHLWQPSGNRYSKTKIKEKKKKLQIKKVNEVDNSCKLLSKCQTEEVTLVHKPITASNLIAEEANSVLYQNQPSSKMKFNFYIEKEGIYILSITESMIIRSSILHIEKFQLLQCCNHYIPRQVNLQGYFINITFKHIHFMHKALLLHIYCSQWDH